MRKTIGIWAALAAVMLAGCGGGGSTVTPQLVAAPNIAPPAGGPPLTASGVRRHVQGSPATP